VAQPRVQRRRLWLGIAGTIVVLAGLAVWMGVQHARLRSAPQPANPSPYVPAYLASGRPSFDPSSEWTCSRWLDAFESDQHTWLVGKLRLLHQLDDLPPAGPREVNDVANSITAHCMTSKTDDNLAVVVSTMYEASRHAG
jgi:hypothetical protein